MLIKKIVTLNNKSRKGTYLYIKEKAGKGRYYRLIDNVPVDSYIEYYRNKTIKKTKKTLANHLENSKKITTIKQKAKENVLRLKLEHKGKWVKKKALVRKNVRIKEGQVISIDHGQSEASIDNVFSKSSSVVKNMTKIAFMPLVRNKALLNDSNIMKLKKHIEVNVQLLDMDNQLIATLTTIGKKTPIEVKREIEEVLHPGLNIIGYRNPEVKSFTNKGYLVSFNAGRPMRLSKITMKVTVRA